MTEKFLKILRTFGLEYFKKYYGIYRATIEDNDDPENLGRLKLNIPQIYGENSYNYWAGSKGIFAGNQIGSFIIPNIGDGVWVEFENGDARYPIWSYGWWAKEQVPEGATIDNKVFQTTSGHHIEFDDGLGLIRVTDKNSNIIELNDKGVSIISDKISLGSLNESSEAVLLGDTSKAKLETLIDKVSSIAQNITTITVPTALGPSGPPINSPAFLVIKTELATLKTSLIETLSKKVTTD